VDNGGRGRDRGEEKWVEGELRTDGGGWRGKVYDGSKGKREKKVGED